MAAAVGRLSPLALHRRFAALAAGDVKTDASVMQEHFQFIRDNDADVAAAQQGGDLAWAVRLARKYYDKLSKAYVVVDLSKYKSGRVGMRWRTPGEVAAGTGQFVCGAVGCAAASDLASLEVPFTYKEGGSRKTALVRARLCPLCTQKMLAASGSSASPAHAERAAAALAAADTGGTKRPRADAPAPAPPTLPKRRRRSVSASPASDAGSAASRASSLRALSDGALLARLLK